MAFDGDFAGVGLAELEVGVGGLWAGYAPLIFYCSIRDDFEAKERGGNIPSS